MEETHKSTASELDGLPDVDRKETEEILAEIEKDEKPSDQKPPEEQKPEKKPEDGKPADEQKPPEKKPEERKPSDERKPSPERKQPGLMPRYAHEIAMKDKDKSISDLTAEVERLKAGKGPSSEEVRTPEQANDLKSKVEKMAQTLSEKHTGVSKELIQDLAQSMVDLGITSAGELPKAVQEQLKAVDAFTAAQEIQAEEQAFRSAFDEHIIPLIKQEYGDLPEDTISEIRKVMMEKAYSDEFAKTPYSVIYKGLDEFRGFKRTPAKSAEASRGGHERAGDAAPEGDDSEFENVTDEDIEKMDPATFDRYTAFQERKETGRVRAS